MSEIEIERACAALVATFPYCIDNRDYDGVIALFAPNGTFERPGVSVTGHAQLRKMLEDRPADISTRHVCSQPVFISFTKSEAQAVTCFVLYQSMDRESKIPQFDGPSAIAEYHDTFRQVDGAWRIAARQVKVAMVTCA